MSDYFLGLVISSLIALLMSIKKTWRLRPNGLTNALILAVIFVLSFIISVTTNSSSGPLLGFLGIITIPIYLVVKNRSPAEIKDAKVPEPIKSSKPSNAKVVVEATEQLPATYQNTSTDIKVHKPASGMEENENKLVPLPPKNNAQSLDFPSWYVSISFGKSSSQNFPQALALAKMAPKYIENEVEGKTLYQAIYSDKLSEYLSFIKLYELVRNWKSCFVVINDQHIDRKIIGGLNYCYGDKCRSGNPDFCYGASYMTENPFGCHRIQISACNNPWWTFGVFDTKGIWHVDKKAILERIMEYSEPYRLCPAFSLDRVVDGLKKLPDTINPKTDSDWVVIGETIRPSSNPNTITYTIKLEQPDNKQKTKNNIGFGCFTVITLIVLIALSVFLAII